MFFNIMRIYTIKTAIVFKKPIMQHIHGKFVEIVILFDIYYGVPNFANNIQ